MNPFLKKCDTVIHLAGTHSTNATDCYQDLAAFIMLMEEMRKHGTKKLILCSSASVYGDDVKSPVNEDHPINPSNPYGHYKVMCEQIAKDYEQYGIKTVIIRPFNASGGLAKFIPAVKSGKVTICGDGSAIRDFVHPEDVADAFIKAINVDSGVFNIGAGVGITLNEIVALRKNVEVDFQPPRQNDPHELVADITRARTVLGWSPKHTIEDILC